jgi:magnesium-transporting ATPase (P-type)
MLPMIVTICLSKGAMAMGKRKVIVKRLNAIQNLGAMDVLCTDKTGTLTRDEIILEKYCDVSLRPSEDVVALAYVNSHFQTGLKNMLDRAVLAHEASHAHGRVPELTKLTTAELAAAAEQTTPFARVSPAHKQRIIEALQSRGHTVGFMGDGINDAPALHAADVGISVDTAVDIAKEAADLILLEKSLLVLDEGVLEGRKVFSNIIKYVRMGASSNFGNMFSVLGASRGSADQ